MILKEYKIISAIPLDNHGNYKFLIERIRSAKKRIYASIFIIEPRVSSDIDLLVRNLMKELQSASKRKVDVKIIHGNSNTPDIYSANYVAHNFFKFLNIESRKFLSADTDNLHSKYYLIDDEITVIGSSNWSPGGFSKHDEDSIAVYSKQLNNDLTKRFLSNWKTSNKNF